MSSPDALTELLMQHRFDGDTYEPTGEVWMSCTCPRTDMWGGDNPWPVDLIRRVEAERLHAEHVAAAIRDEGLAR